MSDLHACFTSISCEGLGNYLTVLQQPRGIIPELTD